MPENRERRDLLRDRALDVLAREGAHRLTHRRVDEAAGVPPGTTKNYFPTRAALLRAAADRAHQRYRDDVEAFRALGGGPPDRASLARTLAEVIRRAVGPERPRLLATLELYAAAARDPELRPAIAEMTASDFALYEHLQRAAGLPVTPERSAVLARCVHAALLSLLTHPPDALAAAGLDDLDRFVAGVLDVLYPTGD